MSDCARRTHDRLDDVLARNGDAAHGSGGGAASRGGGAALAKPIHLGGCADCDAGGAVFLPVVASPGGTDPGSDGSDRLHTRRRRTGGRSGVVARDFARPDSAAAVGPRIHGAARLWKRGDAEPAESASAMGGGGQWRRRGAYFRRYGSGGGRHSRSGDRGATVVRWSV